MRAQSRRSPSLAPDRNFTTHRDKAGIARDQSESIGDGVGARAWCSSVPTVDGVFAEAPPGSMQQRVPSSSSFADPVVGGRARRVWSAEPERDTNWLVAALGAVATRRQVSARSELFAIGDPAPSFYLLLSGELLIHRRRTPSMVGRGKTAIRLVFPDELFIFDCDGKHLADCSAISDCILLRIDRRRMERLAALDRVLRGVLHRLHANEIEWFLQSMGAYDGKPQHDQLDRPETKSVADPTSEQWRRSTAS